MYGSPVREMWTGLHSEVVMKDPYIADLAKFENQVVLGYFAATQKQLRAKKDGGQYLALTLGDKTGQIEARMWEMAEAGPFEQGDVVKVRAQVCRYKEVLQLNVDRLRSAMPAEYEVGDFVAQTTFDIDQLWAELNGYVASFTDPDLKRLVRAFFDDPEIAAALRQAPAAKSLHHAWIGGLLEHIVSLLGICEVTARHYPEIHRDLLMTGAMLHDIGKLEELKWGTSFEYSMEGTLVGHITMGISMLEHKLAVLPGFPERLRVLITHIILSHHGKYEFGSPKLPMIPEAVLLNFLDDMDAKMMMMRSEFAKAGGAGRDGAQLTEWVRAMERPLLDTRAYLGAKEEKG
jgi:3'-5' exoribonuclease